MFLLYVYEMIITSNDDVKITHLGDALSLRFDMKSLGEVSCFLSLEVKKLDEYFVSQKGYASSPLDHFHMRESKPMTTPMENYLS